MFETRKFQTCGSDFPCWINPIGISTSNSVLNHAELATYCSGAKFQRVDDSGSYTFCRPCLPISFHKISNSHKLFVSFQNWNPKFGPVFAKYFGMLLCQTLIVVQFQKLKGWLRYRKPKKPDKLASGEHGDVDSQRCLPGVCVYCTHQKLEPRIHQIN